MEKIAIAGAGMTGAYLYRRLRQQGIVADLYEKERQTRCGLHPCAWGTSGGFSGLVEAAGLDPKAYILHRSDYVLIDEVKIPAELMTFDKPKLIRDLVSGTTIKLSGLPTNRYDRIIDATGIARAFLPAIRHDVVLECIQWRVQTDELLPNRIKLGSIGYAWCFPLSGGRFHIGCGSLSTNPRETIRSLGWLNDTASGRRKKAVCSCEAKVRLASPHFSLPFYADNRKNGYWGVGEAIGCVAPLAGDGVVPGMQSVQILLDNWDDPEGYTAGILQEFDWMRKERGVIDKLRNKKHLGIREAWVLKQNSKRMGMRVGIREALDLIHRLR